MNVPLERKAVRMERHIGADTQQVVVEAACALPANAADMARIVRLAAYPVITDRSALEDEIVVHGAVDFVLVYAHEERVARAVPSPPPPTDEDEGTEIEAERGYDPDDGLTEDEYREVLHRHRWRRGAVFEAVFDVPGAHADAIVDVKAEPLDIDVHLHANGRGFDVEAVVQASVRVGGDHTQSVFVKGKDFPADVDAQERTLSVEDVFARGRTNISVEGTLPLSTEIPARTVVSIGAKVRADEVRLEPGADGDGRIEGHGFIDYEAVVMDEHGAMDAFVWQQQTPFSFGLEVHGVSAEATDDDVVAEAEAFVRGLDAAPSADGRGVDVFADIDIVARAARIDTLTFATTISGDEEQELRYRTDTFHLEQWIGKDVKESSTTGHLDLPHGQPPVERLLESTATPRVEDVLVLGDKVIIEGSFDVAALYVARTEGSPVHYVYWNGALPLEAEVPVPGAEPGMEADIKVDVVGAELDLLNRESAEATVRYKARAKVTHPAEVEAVVEAVSVSAPEEDPPTLTFVIVQPDDTLWKLSHRYHTDVSDIVRANAWLESEDDELPEGRKLCVPRRKPAPSPTV